MDRKIDIFSQWTELTPWIRVLLKKLTVHSAGQEIVHLLWNLKVHYHVHKSSPPVPILNQINPVHTLVPYFPKVFSGPKLKNDG
jgi:hypothetical protein